MTNPLAAFAVLQFSMQTDSLLLGKILLLEFELSCEVEETQPLSFLRSDFIEESKVVPEEKDG